MATACVGIARGGEIIEHQTVFLRPNCTVAWVRRDGFEEIVTPTTRLWGLLREVHCSERVPWWAGVVLYSASECARWVAPIPLNVAMRCAWLAWLGLKDPFGRGGWMFEMKRTKGGE